MGLSGVGNGSWDLGGEKSQRRWRKNEEVGCSSGPRMEGKENDDDDGDEVEDEQQEERVVIGLERLACWFLSQTVCASLSPLSL